MIIRKIEATHFRAFESLEVEFNDGFNILCGVNGAGKSTVLSAIASCLQYKYGALNSLSEGSFLRLDYIGRKDQKLRFVLPSEHLKRDENRVLRLIKQGVLKVNGGIVDYEQDKSGYASPLCIGPSRSIEQSVVTSIIAEMTVATARDYYVNKALEFLENSYMPNVKQWMVNRFFMIDKNWAATERTNWYLVINRLNDIADGADFQFDEVERNLQPVFTLNGRKTYLEELSSGFQSVLAMVFSIVEWIETTNEGDEALIENAKGTVLIDEIDAHLHPSWQMRIKGILQGLFPNVQFIVTTHSPHVISSAGKGEVGMLKNDNGHLTVDYVDGDIQNWKTDYIYSDIMGFEPTYDHSLEQFVDKVEGLIEAQNYTEALTLVEAYSHQAHPNDPTPFTFKRRIERIQQKAVVDGVANG